jgi:hypothetical protein
MYMSEVITLETSPKFLPVGLLAPKGTEGRTILSKKFPVRSPYWTDREPVPTLLPRGLLDVGI